MLPLLQMRLNAAIAFCEEHEFVHYLAMALILRGWASADQGEFEKGIAEIQEGLEKKRATGALCIESYSLGLMRGCMHQEQTLRQASRLFEAGAIEARWRELRTLLRGRNISFAWRNVSSIEPRSGSGGALFLAKVLKSRANRKPNPLNLEFV